MDILVFLNLNVQTDIQIFLASETDTLIKKAIVFIVGILN